jgi:hypothetical protein
MTIQQLATLSITTVLAAACHHPVSVSFVEPADIGLPADVETVLVVNRSLPRNAGESILNAGESLATNEGFDADYGTSLVALDALASVLGETDRFEVLQLNIDGKRVDTSLFDKPLDARTAIKLCKRHDCDAVIALDALDTDTINRVIGEKVAGEPPSFTGTADASIGATFRVYDGDTGAVLDTSKVHRHTSAETTSERRDEAMAVFGRNGQLQNHLARTVGNTYGERISPHIVSVQRGWYAVGSPELRKAALFAKADNWDRAARIWTKILDSEDAHDIAKARHNLAVHNELQGNLKKARNLASRAERTLSRPKTQGYSLAISERIADAEELERQMAGSSNPV